MKVAGSIVILLVLLSVALYVLVPITVAFNVVDIVQHGVNFWNVFWLACCAVAFPNVVIGGKK